MSLSRLIFIVGQFVLWGVLLWVVVRRRAQGDLDSQFKEDQRESARMRTRGRPRLRSVPNEDPKEGERGVPLLEGFVENRPPHEILGVSSQATEKEIARAYRELMKRFHPDRVGPPGSREWKDAQRIANIINQARDQLLKRS